MRADLLVARRNEQGDEVLVVHQPVLFTLEDTARAMHAVVDAHWARSGTRQRAGKARVRQVLRQIAADGWPSEFAPDGDRVRFWRDWLVEQGVFHGQALNIRSPD